jgi:subtilisin family serine protease
VGRIQLWRLFFCGLVSGVFFPGAPPSAQTGAPENPQIPQRVRERVARQGTARVIVKLRLPGGDYASEKQLGTAPAVNAQRRRISAAQRTVLDRLWTTGHRVNREYRTLPYLALEVGPAALPALESSPAVLEVFEDRLSIPLLDHSGPLVQAPQAWSSGFDGTGTVVAILDTGVEKNHPFFSNRIVEEACFSANGNCPNGQPSQIGPGSGAPCAYAPQDCDHGTHVAGIAAGSGATAGTPFSGVAPGATLMAVQVFSRFEDPVCADFGAQSPCALSFDSDQIAGLERIYELRNSYTFAAANLSLGGGFSPEHCDSAPIKQAIDNLRAAGIATVIASGNDGFTDGISFPACVSSAVSVGGTTASDSIAGFSNNASFLSVLAPAINVNSSVPGGAFASFSGTSMSTAHVSGALAVMKQAFPADSVDDVLAVLKGTGRFVSDARDPSAVIRKPRISLCDALASITAIQFIGGYSALEGAGPAQISLLRWGGCIFNSAAVNFQTSPGNATPGLDYTTTSGTLTFASGVGSQTFSVAITNDAASEANETVNLSLLPPGSGTVGRFDGQYSGAYSGTSSTSGALSGDIAFTVANGSVQILDPGTGAGSVLNSGAFSANGNGGQSGASCSYNGTLSLAGDGNPQGSGTFACTFTGGSASGNWTAAQFRQRLMVPPTAVLTILDNDGSGSIQFGQAEYTAQEKRRRASVTVTRTGGTGGVTVDYSTSGGSATANADYRPRVGTLSFSSGETAKTFKVVVLKDKVVDPGETVNLALSNPSGGATLGPRQTAVLRIIDGEGPNPPGFDSGSFTASEPSGRSPRTFKVTMRRAGELSGETARRAAGDGTATGADLAAASGTLTFGTGAALRKFFVWVLPDSETEESETINLALPDAAGGAAPGDPGDAEIMTHESD